MHRPRIVLTLAAAVICAGLGTAPSAGAEDASQRILPTVAVDRPRDRIVIHGVGDIALCNCFHDAFRAAGHDLAFSGMGGLFRRDDLTIGNLECAPVDGGRPLSDKPQSIRCDTAALPVLSRHGVEVVSLANNHSADFGFDLVSVGRANVAAVHVQPVGAGANLAEANQAAFFVRGGWTIAVVGFSGVTGLSYSGAYPKTEELVNPWFATGSTPGIAPASFGNMAEVVSALDAVADIVIVSLHQGEFNETRRPTDLEVRRARALIEAGADAVIAHHHHRLLPFEYFQGRPIFWGMGNFVWSARGREYDSTAVAEIVIEADGTITGRLVSAYIMSHGHPVLQGMPDWAVRPERAGMG